MDIRLKCEKPGEIEYTMTITMRADDWEKLRDQLESTSIVVAPAYTLIRQVNDLLRQARKIYWPQEPDAE